jgi:pre-mRNA-splicing factor SYF1
VADGPVDARDAMARLDAAHEARAATATAAAVPGFVRSHVEGATTGGDAGATGGGDDAEIDLGDDDDDAFAERPVPTSVFGGTTTTNKRDAADAELGAAERFKRARENA